jgi:Zn-dependent metalloprotease
MTAILSKTKHRLGWALAAATALVGLPVACNAPDSTTLDSSTTPESTIKEEDPTIRLNLATTHMVSLQKADARLTKLDVFEAPTLDKGRDDGVWRYGFEAKLKGQPVYGVNPVVSVRPNGQLSTRIPSALERPIHEGRVVIQQADALRTATAKLPEDAKTVERTEVQLGYHLMPDGFHLGYLVILSIAPGESEVLQFIVLVDAETGAVLLANDATQGLTGLAHTQHFGDVSIETTQTAKGATLKEPASGNTTTSYYKYSPAQLITMDTTQSYGFGYLDSDNDWGDGQPLVFGDVWTASMNPLTVRGQTAAVEAMFMMHLADAFFLQLGNQTPLNGVGMSAIVHYWNNSKYGRGGISVYSGGAQSIRGAQTSFNDLGHEISHAYFDRRVNPTYLPVDGEHPAIDEADSDIFGEMMERGWARRNCAFGVPCAASNDWTVLVGGDVLRNMYQPSLDGHSYDAWSPQIEIGQVDSHYGNGPVNRMFYFLSEGVKPTGKYVVGKTHATQTSPDLPQGLVGITPEAALQIWHRTVTQCLPDPNGSPVTTLFIDLRDAMVECAESSTLAERQAVEDAWAAVHVGAPADRTPPKASAAVQDLGNTVRVQGTASDFVGVTEIDMSIDGAPAWPQYQAGVLDQGQRYPQYPQSVPYTFDVPTATLQGGSHTAVVTVFDKIGNQKAVSVPFTLAIPNITGVTASGPKKKPTLTVAVTDTVPITQVRVERAGVVLATALQAPFALPIDTSTWADGTYALNIVATNSLGRTTEVAYSQRADNTAPAAKLVVTGTMPPFTLAASGTDASALVKATFRVDGTVLTTVQQVPSQASYTPSGPATQVSVEITDDYGNIGTATAPAPLDHAPPTVTWNFHQWGTAVNFNIAVSDSCGITLPYAFYVDNNFYAATSVASTSLLVGPLNPGAHVLTVSVSDRCGNMSNVDIPFVKYWTPPTVTSVTRNDTDPKRPRFTVTCSDADGIDHVEIRDASDQVLASDNTSPYQLTVDTSTWPDGDSALRIYCYDTYGVWSAPSPVNVTADNTGPTLQLSVYGGGHTYQVTAIATDPRGIASLTLTGGLVAGFSWQFPSAPYSLVWTLPYDFSGWMPFSIVAKDNWGNQRSMSYQCLMDTSTTQVANVLCQALP